MLCNDIIYVLNVVFKYRVSPFPLDREYQNQILKMYKVDCMQNIWGSLITLNVKAWI